MHARRPSVWVLPFLLAVALFAGGVWWFAYRAALEQLAERGRADLSLASDRLTLQLFRYRELAVVLGSHPSVLALLSGQDNAQETVALLQAMVDKTGAQRLAVVDRSGRVLAASQSGAARLDPTGLPLSRAMNGALGSANFVEETDGQLRRIYSFAAPVFAETGPSLGAIMADVDVFFFEQNWPANASALFFSDGAGRVFVSNRSELVLVPRFEAAGFLNHRSSDLFGQETWTLDGGPYLPRNALHLARDLPVVGLTAEILLDTATARRNAGLQAAVAAALCLAFGAVLFIVFDRRRALVDRLAVEAKANARLEARVAERTKALSTALSDLRREVSERKDAEAALKKAQADLVRAGKLSALGQMSAGISHELNQPLMAIRSFAENAELFLDRGNTDQAAKNLTRISELARRMGRIIKNLRAFARQESEPIGNVDIVQVIESALEMVEGRLQTMGVDLHWQAPGAPVMVRGGEVRLQQVVTNLMTNAADAMAASPERRLELTLERQGPRVCFRLRDTGPGIAEPEKVFDPFYTTKEVGASEGMGLGLSISYGLVQSFGGAIKGQNHEGGGAVFTVELDAANQEVAA